MLEKLWLREEVQNKFLYCFLFALIFSLAAIFLTRYLLPFQIMGVSYSGLVAVLLVSLAASYPLVTYLEKDEKREERLKKASEMNLLQRHEYELIIYLSFFLGVAAAFVISYFILPGDFFRIQMETIKSITGQIFSNDRLYMILSNNLWVFFLTFVLSFVISAGMVFILVWNGSVLGVFLASRIKEAGILAPLTYIPTILAVPWYLLSVLIGMLYPKNNMARLKLTFSLLVIIHILSAYDIIGYFPHGLLEISAYILAGLSGFLLSHEIENIKHKGIFSLFLRDAMVLLVLGLILLFLAGFLEVA